jgi:TPP-dependent indolepyruvate ferredoxin oxidoreductase alpha subunit
VTRFGGRVHPDGSRRRRLDRSAPYRDEKHIFTNLGDGTYFHSGILAIRVAVAAAAGGNITYKLLFNGAVATTGGQPIDGTLTVPSTPSDASSSRSPAGCAYSTPSRAS